MAGIERLTITLPSGMAEAVKGAVNDGDYASTSEVVRDALRDWKLKRALQLQEALTALKAEIEKGLADVAAGRVKDFDSNRIIERGRKLLAGCSPLVKPKRPRPILPRFGPGSRRKRPRMSRPAS